MKLPSEDHIAHELLETEEYSDGIDTINVGKAWYKKLLIIARFATRAEHLLTLIQACYTLETVGYLRHKAISCLVDLKQTKD